MKLNLSITGIAITKRFFLAIDTLIVTRRLRGMKTFTDRYGINYWNFNTLRKEPERRILKVEWLSYLVSDYKINPEWLLCGTGKMFVAENTALSGYLNKSN